MATTDEIEQLANAKLRSRLGVRKELKNLNSILHEGEPVLNMASGRYDGNEGLIVATDRRVIFFEKGLARSRQEDFTFSKVTSVQSETGMLGGKLIIFASGNKAIIDHVFPKERATELGDYLRARIADAPPAAAAPTANGPAASSPQERLRRLQNLKDEGLISAGEYDERRTAILADL